MLKLATAALFLLAAAPAPSERPAYAKGQVWEYKTRPHEQDSRVKIQKIEDAGDRAGKIYHVSIVDVHFEGLNSVSNLIQHLPVSRETLDASVTRLAEDQAAVFPSVEEGIAEWRRANGGVFTITLAQVVEFAEQALRNSMQQPLSSP